MGYIEEDESSTIDADSDIYSSIRSLKIIVFPKTVLVFIYSVLKFCGEVGNVIPDEHYKNFDRKSVFGSSQNSD